MSAQLRLGLRSSEERRRSGPTPPSVRHSTHELNSNSLSLSSLSSSSHHSRQH